MTSAHAIEAAVGRAAALLDASHEMATWRERRRSRRLAALLDDPANRELVFVLTDRILRTPDPVTAMAQLRHAVAAGLTDSLPIPDRAAMRVAALASSLLPRPVHAVVRRRIRSETAGVIVPAADPAFAEHVRRRRAEGFRPNVNVLGEAILGDGEADHRLRAVCDRIRRPDVDYVSVKISALCAGLDVLAVDHEVERITGRLRTVFTTAADQDPPVFVNLDMEEYRDLELTVAAFCRVLDEPALRSLPAGIVLQAYLPDSHAVLDRLVAWSARRRHDGGAPLKLRLVKGANLAMELVDAELNGWEPAPYGSKDEVDASFKALLARALDAAAEGDLVVGVGSHNLFDVAWALELRQRRGLERCVGIEMLEGMAPPQARAVVAASGEVVLYTPVVDEDDATAAIAYLARRLDENSGPENFLRSLFTIEVGSPGWERERRRFADAVARSASVDRRPRRRQERTTERRRFDAEDDFANEPDTDFTVAANRRWIAARLTADRPAPLPPLLDSPAAIDAVVGRAREAAADWGRTTTAERRAALCRLAESMAAGRGRTIAVMAHETAKTVREGDTEVSEAIDFARWAATSTHLFDELAADGVTAEPVGVVLVAGPWNFPTAIPTNGVVSALAAGNAVLLKPAPEAVATAVEIVRHVEQAGIPPSTVQLVRCPDDDVGRHLVTHPGTDAIVLTGSYETARMFLGWKPDLHLIAETSGKNALVISRTADVDLALRDLVRSAFGHAGQKCSAASLAIVDAPLYDDPRFRRRLADAVRSLRVGPAHELASQMGPVIATPSGKLLRGLTQLDPGEWWLVEPRCLDGGRLWSPGVRYDVRPGSWFHRTECFGPVLGVIRADGIADAVRIQNQGEFGLTAGIHSLDPDEIELWLDRVEAGNAYVNRHITGAIVRRQPFGGWKRSSVGRGAKTGGPHDVTRFARFRSTASPAGAVASYREWWLRQFGVALDRSGLAAEENVLRYRPVDGVIVRVAVDTPAADVDSLRAAAAVAGVRAVVSGPGGGAAAVDVAETDAELARRLASARVERLRLLAPASHELLAAAHAATVAVDTTTVTHDGRIELPCWLREQAVSRTRHRHGRVSRLPAGAP